MQSSISVLVVEDEDVVRRLLVRLVKQSGHNVTEASDGLQALRAVRDQHFDIVVSDICMPRLDGLELLRELKSRFPHIKIMLTTGYPFEYTAKDAVGAGAEYLLLKPFKNDEFLSIFGRIVEKLSACEDTQEAGRAVESRPEHSKA